MIHKLHQSVPSFKLNLNVEYAENPDEKDFEKTSSYIYIHL